MLGDCDHVPTGKVVLSILLIVERDNLKLLVHVHTHTHQNGMNLQVSS